MSFSKAVWLKLGEEDLRRLPKPSADIDVAQMTEAQLHANTDETLADMDGISNYIANTLLAPENAMGYSELCDDEVVKI